jgi:hypothetical protein
MGTGVSDVPSLIEDRGKELMRDSDLLFIELVFSQWVLFCSCFWVTKLFFLFRPAHRSSSEFLLLCFSVISVIFLFIV